MADAFDKEQIKRWQVLIVDDEPDSLEVATRVLSFYGATVHTATNGREGLAVLTHQQPTFILMDLSMPQMDGWEMLYHVKEDLRTRDIPVIALTAHAMAGDRERALAAGFHYYLTKPFSPATFLQELMSLLAKEPPLLVASQSALGKQEMLTRKDGTGNE